MRDSKCTGFAALTFFLVVTLTLGSASAHQGLVKAVIDSLSPKVIAQLVKAINPVVTPNNTRLTIVPTARPLQAQTGYFESIMFFLWSVGYGVDDKHAFLVGGMLPGMNSELYYLGTKSSIYRSESQQLAAGIMHGDVSEEEEPLSAIYGVATLGDVDAALNIFIAYGKEGSNWANGPLIVLGGERRLGRRTYFVGELPYYKNELVGFPAFGIKRYAEDGGAHWGFTFPFFVSYYFGFGGD